jgi:YegS/Rv2252/BmrU family lipid kinase
MGVGLKSCLVLNPLSGGKRSDGLRRGLERAFRDIVPGGRVTETRGAGDAETIVRSLLADGFECVAVAGGDGTINEAVNGYFAAPGAAADEPRPVNASACLAVVPLGTGGDFRRSLGLEPDPLAALSLLTGSSTVECDVGLATYVDPAGASARRLFVNVASFGLSSLVVEYVNSSHRRVPGPMAYFGSTLRAFGSYRSVQTRLLMDRGEQRVERPLVVAVANGRFFGGGMEIAPEADMRDGLLDVVIVSDVGLGEFVYHAPKLYGGRLTDLPQVAHRRVREISLSTLDGGRRLGLEMDGEALGRTPATISVLPGTLRLKS